MTNTALTAITGTSALLSGVVAVGATGLGSSDCGEFVDVGCAAVGAIVNVAVGDCVVAEAAFVVDSSVLFVAGVLADCVGATTVVVEVVSGTGVALAITVGIGVIVSPLGGVTGAAVDVRSGRSGVSVGGLGTGVLA